MGLEGMIGQRFVQDRHGIRTEVELMGTRGKKVVLQQPGRKDSFKMDTNSFQKKFKPTVERV